MDAKVPQSEIPGVYDSLSKTYDIWGKLAETWARNRAIELAEIEDGQNILEVAVGTGLGFYEIVKKTRMEPISALISLRACCKKPKKDLAN